MKSVVVISLVVLTGVTLGHTAFAAEPTAAMAPIPSAPLAHTPPPGSAERAELMEAIRRHDLRSDAQSPRRVFVVNYLMVQGNWAWLRGSPQSA